MAQLWGQNRLAFSYGLALGLAKVQHAEQKLWTDSGSESGSASSGWT